MKNYCTLLLITLFSCFSFAQTTPKNYQNTSTPSNLWLSDNNFFQFRTQENLMYSYLRGKWEIRENQLILKETYHSEANRNLHHIGKAPKFAYTTATRITTFIINGNELTLLNQEIQPESAKFLANFDQNLFIHQEK